MIFQTDVISPFVLLPKPFHQTDTQMWHVWSFVVYEWFLDVCRRQRELKPGQSPYRALLDTLELSNSRLSLQLINDNNKVTKYTKIHTSITVSSQQMFGLKSQWNQNYKSCFLMIIKFNCNIYFKWCIHACHLI